MKKVGTCRICFTGSCYKNLNNDYAYLGELENYRQMMRETFSIILKSNRSLICEKCIKKLRDATKFKQKILNAEKYLLEKNEQIEEKLDSDLELESDIEVENKRTTVKSERKAIIGFNGEDFVIELGKSQIKRKQNLNEVPSDFENDDFYSITEEKVTKVAKKNVSNFTNKFKKKLTKKTPEAPKLSSTQKNLRENTHKLITNSNLCIFKSLRTKFACTYCNESFFDFKELRRHSESHINVENKICLRLRGLSYKNAEITDLKCKICNQNTENLETLKLHLENHNFKFGGEGRHLLIPYKLEENYQCVVCQEIFNTFTRLVIHMNTHSTHNVCEKCGLSYFNRSSLRNHIRNQHYHKNCSFCDEKFLTISDKAKHMKKIHRIGYEKRYCLRCNMTFPYTYQLIEHRVEKHGFQKLTVTCHYCGKLIKSATNLRIHIRNVHLKERNFSCNICDMRFFTKNDKMRHEKTHLDLRSYSCNFCETKFKSKDSVRRHLKRQHGQDKDLGEFHMLELTE